MPLLPVKWSKTRQALYNTWMNATDEAPVDQLAPVAGSTAHSSPITTHHANGEPRGSRGRNGPLTNKQRAHAALIRAIKSCPTCRQKRVKCKDEDHHDLSAFHERYLAEFPLQTRGVQGGPDGLPLNPAVRDARLFDIPQQVELDPEHPSSHDTAPLPFLEVPFLETTFDVRHDVLNTLPWMHHDNSEPQTDRLLHPPTATPSYPSSNLAAGASPFSLAHTASDAPILTHRSHSSSRPWDTVSTVPTSNTLATSNSSGRRSIAIGKEIRWEGLGWWQCQSRCQDSMWEIESDTVQPCSKEFWNVVDLELHYSEVHAWRDYLEGFFSGSGYCIRKCAGCESIILGEQCMLCPEHTPSSKWRYWTLNLTSTSSHERQLDQRGDYSRDGGEDGPGGGDGDDAGDGAGAGFPAPGIRGNRNSDSGTIWSSMARSSQGYPG